ncbi:MAG: superoxide dismutase family protein [Planctomycetes bacterium]|nr:superoxide dismutase family protein [Planctomycetota bacterium]
MMRRALLGLVLCAAAAALATACASASKAPLDSAVAVLGPASGSKVSGKAVFTRMEGDWIRIRIDIAGAEPGLHAVHIHEHGDCSSPDAMSAGGHWNPTMKKHGRFGQADGEFHLGDLGNIEVGADGTGYLELTTPLLGMGCGCEKDFLGRSIIVHAKRDDFTTQPTGDAGARIGCGVIRAGR